MRRAPILAHSRPARQPLEDTIPFPAPARRPDRRDPPAPRAGARRAGAGTWHRRRRLRPGRRREFRRQRRAGGAATGCAARRTGADAAALSRQPGQSRQWRHRIADHRLQAARPRTVPLGGAQPRQEPRRRASAAALAPSARGGPVRAARLRGGDSDARGFRGLGRRLSRRSLRQRPPWHRRSRRRGGRDRFAGQAALTWIVRAS